MDLIFAGPPFNLSKDYGATPAGKKIDDKLPDEEDYRSARHHGIGQAFDDCATGLVQFASY